MTTPKTNITESIDPDLLAEDTSDSSVVLDQTAISGMAIPTVLNNVFNLDELRFVPNFEVMTLERFIYIANAVIQDKQDRDGILVGERVKLVEQYPFEEMHRLGDEVIVYRVKYRRPASMSKTGTGTVSRGYIHEMAVQSPEHPNKILTIEKRLLDHEIEFACWSKSAGLANKRALWLERLFVNSTWAFKSQGADRFHFVGRSIDTYQNSNGQRFFVRPLTFFLRIPEFRVKSDSILRQIEFEVKASDTSTF